MEFNESEYHALLNLLDDDDSEVVNHVFEKIKQIGSVGIPILEKKFPLGSPGLQLKIRELLETFQYSKIFEELKDWSNQDNGELYKAVYLVSKVIHPDLEESTISRQIETISQRIWLRIYQNQSAFEQIQVFNYVLFSEIGFMNSGTIDNDYKYNLVNYILDSRKGNTLGIGLIYLLIAENLELSIYGINLPHLFALTFTKYWHSQVSLNNQDDITDVLFYINLATNGTTFSRLEIDKYLINNKIGANRSYYQPCSNKVIVQLLIEKLIENLDSTNYPLEYEQLEKMAQLFVK